MIDSLGRQSTEDKLTIYIKQENEADKSQQQPPPVEQSPLSRRRSDQTGGSEGSGTASRLLNRYRQQTPLDVPNDLLRTIEEVDRNKNAAEEAYDRSPGPLPPTTAQVNPLLSAADRDKKRYQRTMVLHANLLTVSVIV